MRILRIFTDRCKQFKVLSMILEFPSWWIGLQRKFNASHNSIKHTGFIPRKQNHGKLFGKLLPLCEIDGLSCFNRRCKRRWAVMFNRKCKRRNKQAGRIPGSFLCSLIPFSDLVEHLDHFPFGLVGDFWCCELDKCTGKSYLEIQRHQDMWSMDVQRKSISIRQNTQNVRYYGHLTVCGFLNHNPSDVIKSAFMHYRNQFALYFHPQATVCTWQTQVVRKKLVSTVKAQQHVLQSA